MYRQFLYAIQTLQCCRLYKVYTYILGKSYPCIECTYTRLCSISSPDLELEALWWAPIALVKFGQQTGANAAHTRDLGCKIGLAASPPPTPPLAANLGISH
jgi:hypothetical protein